MQNKKICIVSTISTTLESFVIPVARYMQANGWDVTLASSMDPKFIEKYNEEFTCLNIPMNRGVSIVDCFKMPFLFRRIFKNRKYDIIQYATPNASLYASLGAFMAGCKKRLYCQWGIRYVSNDGVMRAILKILERITCLLSTHIRPASWKNLDFAVSEGLYKREKALVIADGGTIGVNLKQFDLSKKTITRANVLEKYPQLKNRLVFCFVGRLNKDKGCYELLKAFKQLSNERDDIALMFVGRSDGFDEKILLEYKLWDNVIFTGQVQENKVQDYISAADVLVHPSYREGFSMVIQQAMAMELPVITTDIPGPSEVIEKGITGILAKARDVNTLYNCMKWMAEHPGERVQMGIEGRKRCVKRFARERMLKLTLEDREQILNS